MASLPTRCDETGLLLLGDTVACRYKHLGSAMSNALVHCAHLGNESSYCHLAQCPSATRRLQQSTSSSSDGSPQSLATALIVCEVALAAAVLLAVIASCFSWRRARSNYPREWRAEEAPGAASSTPSAEQPSRTDRAMDILQRAQLPSLHCADFELVLHGSRALSVKHLRLGGCRLTAVLSASGSGKTTLFRLLAGSRCAFAHVKASSFELSGGRIGYCPQDSSHWPVEMRVIDALVLACQLKSTTLHAHRAVIETLGLVPLLHQTHGSLSGGQKQRMNLAATLMCPTPCLMLLDEPLAALDERTALAVLKLLRSLPHAFCLTVHKPSEAAAALFDRLLVLDRRQRAVVSHGEGPRLLQRLSTRDLAACGEIAAGQLPPSSSAGALSAPPSTTTPASPLPSPPPSPPPSEAVAVVIDTLRGHRPSALASYRAAFTLWHSQLFGAPLVEGASAFSCAAGGVLIGCMGAPLTTAPPPLETRLFGYFGLFVAMCAAGLAFVSSFQVGLVYAERERHLLSFYAETGALHSAAAAGVAAVRAIFFGLGLSATWLLPAHSLLGLTTNLSVVWLSTSAFVASWILLAFVLTLLGPVQAMSVHGVMGLNCFALFFTGLFQPWHTVTPLFRLLHYVNPLFHLATSNIRLTLLALDPGCPPVAHPGACASFDYILRLGGTPEVPAEQTQAFSLSMMLVLGAALALGLHCKRRPLRWQLHGPVRSPFATPRSSSSRPGGSRPAVLSPARWPRPSMPAAPPADAREQASLPGGATAVEDEIEPALLSMRSMSHIHYE